MLEITVFRALHLGCEMFDMFTRRGEGLVKCLVVVLSGCDNEQPRWHSVISWTERKCLCWSSGILCSIVLDQVVSGILLPRFSKFLVCSFVAMTKRCAYPRTS